jgi:hypothetical protein
MGPVRFPSCRNKARFTERYCCDLGHDCWKDIQPIVADLVVYSAYIAPWRAPTAARRLRFAPSKFAFVFCHNKSKSARFFACFSAIGPPHRRAPEAHHKPQNRPTPRHPLAARCSSQVERRGGCVTLSRGALLMADDDEKEWLSDEEIEDAYVKRAREDLLQVISDRPGDVFYERQLQVRFERRF